MATDYRGDWEPEVDYTGHQWFTVRLFSIDLVNSSNIPVQNLPPKAKVRCTLVCTCTNG